MPLVDITYDRIVPEAELRRLADCMPDLVAHAVDCSDEPWTGPAEPGDIEIRFHAKSAHDVGDLLLVVEVRTKVFPSLVADKQRRADLVRNGLSRLGFEQFGVWLILTDGAWSQSF